MVMEMKQSVLTEKRKHMVAAAFQGSEDAPGVSLNNHVHFDVCLLDKSYLLHDFQADSISAQQVIDDTVMQFGLNEEQERVPFTS